MKVRSGFVSNSSTSSFAIFGIPINVAAMYKKIFNEDPINRQNGCSHQYDRENTEIKFCPSCGKPKTIECKICDYDMGDSIEGHFSEQKLSVSRASSDPDCEPDMYILGKNLNKSTSVQDIVDAEKLLKEILPNDKPTFYCGSYYS